MTHPTRGPRTNVRAPRRDGDQLLNRLLTPSPDAVRRPPAKPAARTARSVDFTPFFPFARKR